MKVKKNHMEKGGELAGKDFEKVCLGFTEAGRVWSSEPGEHTLSQTACFGKDTFKRKGGRKLGTIPGPGPKSRNGRTARKIRFGERVL